MHWLSHLGIKTPKRCKSTRHKLWPVIGPHVSGNVDSILLDGHVLTVAPLFSATSGPPFDTFVRVPDKEWTNSFLSFLPVVKSNVSYLFFWFSLAQKKVFSKASFLPKAWRTVWSTQFMKCNKCYRSTRDRSFSIAIVKLMTTIETSILYAMIHWINSQGEHPTVPSSLSQIWTHICHQMSPAFYIFL